MSNRNYQDIGTGLSYFALQQVLNSNFRTLDDSKVDRVVPTRPNTLMSFAQDGSILDTHKVIGTGTLSTNYYFTSVKVTKAFAPGLSGTHLLVQGPNIPLISFFKVSGSGTSRIYNCLDSAVELRNLFYSVERGSWVIADSENVPLYQLIPDKYDSENQDLVGVWYSLTNPNDCVVSSAAEVRLSDAEGAYFLSSVENTFTRNGSAGVYTLVYSPNTNDWKLTSALGGSLECEVSASKQLAASPEILATESSIVSYISMLEYANKQAQKPLRQCNPPDTDWTIPIQTFDLNGSPLDISTLAECPRLLNAYFVVLSDKEGQPLAPGYFMLSTDGSPAHSFDILFYTGSASNGVTRQSVAYVVDSSEYSTEAAFVESLRDSADLLPVEVLNYTVPVQHGSVVAVTRIQGNQVIMSHAATQFLIPITDNDSAEDFDSSKITINLDGYVPGVSLSNDNPFGFSGRCSYTKETESVVNSLLLSEDYYDKLWTISNDSKQDCPGISITENPWNLIPLGFSGIRGSHLGLFRKIQGSITVSRPTPSSYTVSTSSNMSHRVQPYDNPNQYCASNVVRSDISSCVSSDTSFSCKGLLLSVFGLLMGAKIWVSYD